MPNFMKIRPVETELYHAHGRTARQRDVTKLIVAFRNFAKEPKNSKPGNPHWKESLPGQ